MKGNHPNQNLLINNDNTSNYNPIAYNFVYKTNVNIKIGSDEAFVFLLSEKNKARFIPQDIKERHARIYINCPGQIQTVKLKPDETAHQLTINKAFVEIFMLNSNSFNDAFAHYTILPHQIELYKMLLSDFSLLRNELKLGGISRKTIELRTRLILRMVYDLISDGPTKGNNELPRIILDLNRLVDQNYIIHRNTTYYSKELAISPSHLTVLCRKYLGMTTKEVIDQSIIKEARSLLFHTNLSIKEITFKLNFKSMASFTHYLKSKTGLTPKQIRSSIY